MTEKGQARAGKNARNQLVRALLQTAFDNLPGDSVDTPLPEDEIGALTLSQAAERAQLSRPSISAARDQLRPMLRETVGPHAAQSIALDPSQGVAFGVEFRLDQLTVCMADLYGRPIGEPRQESKGHEEDPRATLDRAARMIEACLQDADRGSDAVVGVGMSLAHPVDPRNTGVVRALSTVDDRGWQLWQGLGDVRQQLRQRLRWPELREPRLDKFIAENDANLSAFAEGRWGAARGRQHALYVYWADGIGSGLIVDGKVHRGAGGIAGAIGHMPMVDGQGPEKCPRCGMEGCLETVAASKAILSRAGLGDGPGAIDRLVAEATESRESPAARALDDAAFHLGRALGICLHVLNPEAIVLGGSLGFKAFELVRNDGLERGLRRQAVPSARDDVNVGGIHRARFANHTSVRGAIAQVLWEFLPDFLDRRSGL